MTTVSKFVLLIVLLTASACGGYQLAALPPSHPSSPAAPEGMIPPAQPELMGSRIDGPAVSAQSTASPEKGDGHDHVPPENQPQHPQDPPAHDPHQGEHHHENGDQEPARETEYTCPMHPEIVRSEPGSCPLCKMDLVAQQPESDPEPKR